MPWSEWITPEPTTIEEFGGKELASTFYGVVDFIDDDGTHGGTQESESDPDAYDCVWSWARRGFVMPTFPTGVANADTWTGACPTDPLTRDRDYRLNLAYTGSSGTVAAHYQTGIPSSDISLGIGNIMSMHVLRKPYINNFYRGDWGDDWVDVEYEADRYAEAEVLNVEIDVIAVSDLAEPATEATSYVVIYPSWAEPEVSVGDDFGLRVSGQTAYGVNSFENPSGGRHPALYGGVEGPESLGDWDDIAAGSTETIVLDNTVVSAQADTSTGWPYSGSGGVVVLAALTAALGSSAPDFEPKGYIQSGFLYGAKVTTKIRVTAQKCRYRYFTEDVIPPDPPGEPITTSITGSNGSARRSFYNARRRH